MNPQEAALPLHLQYRRDEDVVRAEQALSSTVEATTRRLATTNHVNPKQFAEQHLMPIVAHIVQFFSMQHADLLRFMVSALAHQEREEVTESLVGIPSDDVEAILSELERLDLFLVKVNDLGGNKQLVVEEIKKEAVELRETVSDLAEAIQDYSLEETGDEPEYIELEDDEPVGAPAAPEDEPLIEEEANA
jgi:hypothetical protein